MSQEMIANRHRGNLKGCFEDTRLPARVTLILSAEVAHHPVAQHLCWMLVNLLARQAFEIREIELAIPAGIAPVERLSPLISGATDLRVALREGISRIHPDALVPKTTVQSRVSIRVGPGPLGDGDCRLATTAYGWSGYVGRVPADILGNDEHPIGAYIAASLCAGETFKFVRGMKPEAGSFAQQLWLDAASFHVSSEAPTLQGPILPKDLRLTGAVVAGIGAVGNGLLHTLYPLANLQGELHFIDGDPEQGFSQKVKRTHVE